MVCDLQGEEKPVLEDEPVISSGIGGALRVAMTKGFLEHEQIKQFKKVKNKEDLEAQNYSIEDKRYEYVFQYIMLIPITLHVKY